MSDARDIRQRERTAIIRLIRKYERRMQEISKSRAAALQSNIVSASKAGAAAAIIEMIYEHGERLHERINDEAARAMRKRNRRAEASER